MWINEKSGRVYSTHSDIRADFSGVLLPETMTDAVLSEQGVFSVTLVPRPAVAFNQKAIEFPPEKINGVWHQKWLVSEASEQETAENKARIFAEVVTMTQSRLDGFANARMYDGILSLCTYATSTNAKFKVEGQYGVEARDATWAKLYEIMAEVESGTRPMPEGYADIEDELPELDWPDAPQ